MISQSLSQLVTFDHVSESRIDQKDLLLLAMAWLLQDLNPLKVLLLFLLLGASLRLRRSDANRDR